MYCPKCREEFRDVVRKRLLSVMVVQILLWATCCLAMGSYALAEETKKPSFEDFPYYKPRIAIDLKGRTFAFHITDKRKDFSRLECTDITSNVDTEFSGEPGLNYFKDYMAAMTEDSLGNIGGEGENVEIDLEVFTPKIYGFMFRRVYGLVQCTVRTKDYQKKYCFFLKDGDPDAPFGMYSVNWTGKSAMRKMLAGTATKAIEAFLADLDSRSQTSENK